MKIVKRNGVKMDFNPTKILKRIKTQAEGLKVDCDDLFVKVTQGIADNMSTKSVDDLIARTAAGLTTTHPDYSKLAANVCISRHHKDTHDDFLKTAKELFYKNVITEELLNKIKDNVQIIRENIDYKRDYHFDYFGWSTLEEIYLLKFEEKVYERPQDMYMRVALHLNEDINEAIEYYHLISQQLISPATPILLNSGTKNGSLVSCNLTWLKEDSREGILQTLSNISMASAAAEGIGLGLSNLRSKDSFVGANGKAGGLLKMAKMVNEHMRFFNQKGKRPGACALYIEPWHRDIFDVLDIRKNIGKDEERARDLFLALWIPDNFMRAVKEDTDWYLFCPNDIRKAGLKPLYEIYGEEYEVEYQKAVELGIGKKIKATDLWLKILDSQMETGVPYMLYKDHINRKSAQKNIGTIKSSNLCAEITLYSDAFTTAQCILSSIPLQKFLKNGKFDYELLEKAIFYIVKTLNMVIEKNDYSSEEAKKGAREQRALAIGVQGLADLFAILRISFTSDEAKKLNKEIFEAIYYFGLKASCQLAKERNETYPYFEGSPASQGILQFDMWGLADDDLSGKFDWYSLKSQIQKHGLLNANITGDMPTASSAIAIGSNEMYEPFTYNMYTRKTKSGEFVVLTKYLVQHLEELGLWNDMIKSQLIKDNGSIQNIPVIEDSVKEIYKTVYEISQKEILSMSADRAPFVDQTLSQNIYMSKPTVGKLTSSHFYAWERGLKTGQYYLRSEAINLKAQHLGVDLTKTLDGSIAQSNGDYECVGCSA